MMPFQCKSIKDGSDIIVLYINDGLVYYTAEKGKMDFMTHTSLRENYLYSHHIQNQEVTLS